MATATPAPQPTRAAPTPAPHKNEIRIVSHSTLFYWWPVWAIGFLMAGLTLWDGHRMTTVPKGTVVGMIPKGVKAEAVLDETEGKTQPIAGRQVLIPPKEHATDLREPTLEMAANKN